MAAIDVRFVKRIIGAFKFGWIWYFALFMFFFNLDIAGLYAGYGQLAAQEIQKLPYQSKI